MVTRKLLDILACPRTKAPVFQDGNWIVSTDPGTRLRYPIRDGIPVMLIEEAETMTESDWRDALRRNNVEAPEK